MKRILSLLLVLTCLAAVPVYRVGAEAKVVSRQVADYSGLGCCIAIIDVGFDVSHPVFGTMPPSPSLQKEQVAEITAHPDAWVSEKIPYAYDYTDGNSDVYAASFSGTAAASLAAGCFIGQGDVEQEDGTVRHESSFYGAAPDAQLLLMKAAADYSVKIQPDAAANAVYDALKLGADVILMRTDTLAWSDTLQRALLEASRQDVPVLAGAGDVREKYAMSSVPATYTDTGNIGGVARYSTLMLVGSASDPYADVSACLWVLPDGSVQEISYTDSCRDYFGKSFASLLAGGEYECVFVPGVGAAEDFAGLDAAGKIAVVTRGEIAFTEKIRNAADAGAVAVFVVNTEESEVRMALENAPLPAVMLSAADGAALAEAENPQIRFEERKAEVAAHSAGGVFRTLTRGVSFLCAGEYVTAAIPTDMSLPSPYAQISGTYYAAASAAGYLARAMEYCEAADLPRSDAVSLAVQTAEQRGEMSPRYAGMGVLCDEGEYPEICMETSISDAVILPGENRYSTVFFPITIRNTSDMPQTCAISAELWLDSFTEVDGISVTDGERSPFAEGMVMVGESSRNINEASEDAVVRTRTIQPGESLTLGVRVGMSVALWREYAKLYPNGFWIDGAIRIADPDSHVTLQSFTVFFGDWTKGALADVTVYDTENEAVLAAASLSMVLAGGDGYVRYPLGLRNPFSTENDGYEERYQIVNPLYLRDGYAALTLCALRDIDETEIFVYDETGRCVYSHSAGYVGKYLRGGTVEIPLWNFVAEDNDEYFFPDGTYECVVQMSSSFADRRKTTQEMHFSFTVDSVKPEVVSWEVTYTDTQILLSVTGRDDTALRGITVYDGVYSYPYVDEAPGLGETEGVRTFDITRHRFSDTLYLEAIDYATNYAVVALDTSLWAESEPDGDTAVEENDTETGEVAA